MSDPTELAYYVCHGPRRSTIADLAWIAGARWRIDAKVTDAQNERGSRAELPWRKRQVS
ncbi:hypothetical protein ACW9HJ_35080 [Nocardia gipuzkoensis]